MVGETQVPVRASWGKRRIPTLFALTQSIMFLCEWKLVIAAYLRLRSFKRISTVCLCPTRGVPCTLDEPIFWTKPMSNEGKAAHFKNNLPIWTSCVWVFIVVFSLQMRLFVLNSPCFLGLKIGAECCVLPLGQHHVDRVGGRCELWRRRSLIDNCQWT